MVSGKACEVSRGQTVKDYREPCVRELVLHLRYLQEWHNWIIVNQNCTLGCEERVGDCKTQACVGAVGCLLL